MKNLIRAVALCAVCASGGWAQAAQSSAVNSFNDVADVALAEGSTLSSLDSAGGIGFTSGFEQSGTSVPVLKTNNLSVPLVNYVGGQTNAGTHWSMAATTASTGVARRAQTRATPVLDGTIWFSFLASLQNGNGDVALLFNPVLNGSGVVNGLGGMRVGLGHPSRPGAFGVGPNFNGVPDEGAGTGLNFVTNGINGVITTNGFAPTNGTAGLVLGRISDDPATSYRKVDLWYNPDAPDAASLPAPTLSFTNNAATSLVPNSVNRLGFQVVRWSVAQRNEIMDNIKISNQTNAFDVVYKNAAVVIAPQPTNAIINISGVYPHLSVFSSSGEIGIGAVVPWANKLWFVTYPPHVTGSGSDKLWTVDTDLTQSRPRRQTPGTHHHQRRRERASRCDLHPTSARKEIDVAPDDADRGNQIFQLEQSVCGRCFFSPTPRRNCAGFLPKRASKAAARDRLGKKLRGN